MCICWSRKRWICTAPVCGGAVLPSAKIPAAAVESRCVAGTLAAADDIQNIASVNGVFANDDRASAPAWDA